jgi:hypothetical protein
MFYLISLISMQDSGYTFNYSREQYSTYKILGKDISYSDSDVCLHGRYPYANLFEHNIVEFIEADNEHGANGPYNAFFRNRVYEDNIDLYNAPYSAVLGCDTKSSNALEMHGNTSFSIAGNGKTYRTGKSVSYEDAPWVTYFSGPYTYDPEGPNFAMLKDISYFYASRPYFLSSSYTWPSIGPRWNHPYLDNGSYPETISQTIPAEGRYKSGTKTYLSKLTELKPSPPAKDGAAVD